MAAMSMTDILASPSHAQPYLTMPYPTPPGLAATIWDGGYVHDSSRCRGCMSAEPFTQCVMQLAKQRD
jgi:hypothetical protein